MSVSLPNVSKIARFVVVLVVQATFYLHDWQIFSYLLEVEDMFLARV